MKTSILLSFFAAALVATVAAASAQFSSSHVADLGNDFDEKVRIRRSGVKGFDSRQRLLVLICRVMSVLVQVGDGKLYFIKFYAPWCGKDCAASRC